MYRNLSYVVCKGRSKYQYNQPMLLQTQTPKTAQAHY